MSGRIEDTIIPTKYTVTVPLVASGHQLSLGYDSSLTLNGSNLSAVAQEKTAVIKECYYPISTRVNTSVSALQLVDSSATFSALDVNRNVCVQNFDLSYIAWTGTGQSDILRKTFIIGSTTSGTIIATNSFSNVLHSGSTTSITCYLKYYYTDSTTDVSTNQTLSGPASPTTKYYTNPQPAKYVWKIEVYTTTSHASYVTAISNNILPVYKYAKITAFIDAHTLTIDTNIFLTSGMTYEITDIDNQYVVLPNGTATRTLTDSNSTLNGISLPIIDVNYSATQSTLVYFLKVKNTYSTNVGTATLGSLVDVILTSPTNGQSIKYNGTTSLWENVTLSGTGDVVGPAGATTNHVVFFDGATGKLIKDSGLVLTGSNTGDQTTTSLGLNNVDNTSDATKNSASVTLTNKRVTPRILSASSYTTNTGTSLNCDNLDEFIVTAQAGALLFNNPTGTATDGQKLIIAVTGTAARALTWDSQFEASTITLPTTTVTTARLNIGFIWRADNSKWVCVGVA